MRIIRTFSLSAGLLLAAILPVSAQTVLKLGDATPAQFEDGPPLGALRLVPGEIVYFSFTAENFTKSNTGRVDLTGHVQIFDPRGTPVSPAEEIPLVTTLSEEDKNWKAKLRTEIALPPIAVAGTYKVKFDATDNQSHQSASGESSFGVESKYVTPASELVVSELNFYRNQEDTTALITPVYRPGDMVWVKFYMTGYRYGGMNAIDTSYDVEVLGPEGTPIMKQEDAAMQKSMSYYPQPYIPAIFNLSLKSTMSRNVYTLIVTAHDAMGRQTASAKAQFKVD